MNSMAVHVNADKLFLDPSVVADMLESTERCPVLPTTGCQKQFVSIGCDMTSEDGKRLESALKLTNEIKLVDAIKEFCKRLLFQRIHIHP